MSSEKDINLGLGKVAETTEWVSATIVDGNFPDWLSGDLFRIGPGKFECEGAGHVKRDLISLSENEHIDEQSVRRQSTGTPRIYRDSGKGKDEISILAQAKADSGVDILPIPTTRSISLGSCMDQITVQDSKSVSSSPESMNDDESKSSIPIQSQSQQQQQWKVKHWFDGLALLHQFRIQNGKVMYRSKFVCDSFEKKAGVPQNGEDFLSFGPKDPCTNMFQKVHTVFQRIGKLLEGHTNATLATNVNVTVCPTFPLGNESLVLRTDANVLQSIDPATLLPKRMFTYTDITVSPDGSTVPGFISAAHGLVDPETGEYFNFTMDFKPRATGAKCHVFSLKSKPVGSAASMAGIGQKVVLPDARLVSSFDMERASYMHSFSLTPDYVILTAYPYHYNSFAMLYYGNAMSALRYEPSQPTLVYLIPRHGNPSGCSKGAHTNTPIILEMPAFFCFHHINAWQTRKSDQSGTGTNVHFDLMGYHDVQIVEDLLLSNLRKTTNRNPMSETFLRRVSIFIPSSSSSSSSSSSAADVVGLGNDKGNASPGQQKPVLHFEDIRDIEDGSNFSLELPRIRNSMRCKAYRYVYGIHCHEGDFSSALIKIDVRTRRKQVWHRPGHYPGEPIFIAREDTKGLRGEDDGILLSVVLDVAKATSYLMLLDARDMREIGKAVLPCLVPLGFHGNFSRLQGPEEYLD